MKQSILIFDNGELKKIGYFNANTLTFVSQRKESDHYFRKGGGGWAIDKKVFEKLVKQRNLQLVVIDCVDRENKYRAFARQFLEHGKTINYGHGEQILLGIEHWEEFSKDDSEYNFLG